MKKIGILLVTALFFSACDECANLDCVSSNYLGQFRVVRSSDTTDLVFGPAAIYDKNKVRFYSFNGADTVFFDTRPEFFPGVNHDSILLVNFFPQKDVAYMRLSNGDIDTFNISYQSNETKCCDVVTNITNFRFNGTNIPGSQGTQLLKK